jgi:hypothetical protein
MNPKKITLRLFALLAFASWPFTQAFAQSARENARPAAAAPTVA